MRFFVAIFTLFLCCCGQVDSQEQGGQKTTASPDTVLQDEDIGCANNYSWTDTYDATNTLSRRIPPPGSYIRTETKDSSFAGWLRCLPLKKKGTKVLLYNGEFKSNQWAHHAVVDMDVGKKDLQQCADAVIRIRAEYLFAMDAHHLINFNFTSGDNAAYNFWKHGHRPIISNNNVSWQKQADIDESYENFRDFLDVVFTYAGTASLSKELNIVNYADMQIGDLFIQGGFPGHAVLVIDMAENPQTGEQLFLLAQSYMPAQEFHILVNPNNLKLSPWYSLNADAEILDTPEWTFSTSDLKRF